MLIMRSEKRQMTEVKELENKKKLESSEKRKLTSTWEYWMRTTSNKRQKKKKLRKVS